LEGTSYRTVGLFGGVWNCGMAVSRQARFVVPCLLDEVRDRMRAKKQDFI
jgi:hypothetical protein